MREDHPVVMRVRKACQEASKAQSKVIDAKRHEESAFDHMRVTVTEALRQHPEIIRDTLVLHHVICTLNWSSGQVIEFCDEHGIDEARSWFRPRNESPNENICG